VSFGALYNVKMSTLQSISDVLQFWFEELSHEERFNGGEKIDKKITEQFSTTHAAVAAGEWWKERTNAESYLAEIIVLDQFSRNIFRGNARAFAYDGQALTLAQHAVAAGFDTALPAEQRLFMYMPFMHAESRPMHQEAVVLFEALGDDEALKYEHIHKDIIDQFGRYPHRNEVLGRESTTAEIEYLQNNHEAFFNV
jgi:uncharacterized protein (DUF924 family)